MSHEGYTVVDCDGHVVESITEMAEFMSDRIKRHALQPSRSRQGVFPSLDGMHFAAFAYASDYPHEVDLPAAKHEIEEIVERIDMSRQDKQAVLGGNARQFFNI